LKDVWVAQNYPFFAFVEYEDEDDAQDAISYMDGKEYFGSRIKVEVSRQRPSGRRGRGGSYAFRYEHFSYILNGCHYSNVKFNICFVKDNSML